MKHHAVYNITIKIKLHTSPLRELIYDKTGTFLGETKSYYVFEGFRVRKSTVVGIQEVTP